MLIEFKVANYRSIRTEQTLSMVASNYSDELPQNLISCDHVPGLKGTKLVKAVALYGANASGKSNIVAALRFFAEFVRDSATKYQPNDPTGAQPFKLDPACLTQPSKFEITAVINGIRTLYGLELTRERVTSEYLVAYPKGRPQVWFERDWDEAKEKYVWSKSTMHFKHDAALREKTRENAAFLTTTAQFNHHQASTLTKWIEQSIWFLDINRNFAVGGAARHLLAHANTSMALASLLSRADIGVTSIAKRATGEGELASELLRAANATDPPEGVEEILRDLRAEKLPQNLVSTLCSIFEDHPLPELIHASVNGRKVPLDFFNEESTGTRRYFELVSEVLTAFVMPRFMVADEIETSLHPLLVREAVSIHLRAKASRGSQLFFTTHSPLLLDQTLLRRDQIWFTEKDQEGATRLYPLTDFKPRRDESLVKGYLAGRYGGIPFIPEGLKF